MAIIILLLMVVHLPAGLRKKIEALAKQKQCELVAKWQKSIINHLYWCVASTTDGNGDTIKVKWLSLDNHIHNKHTSHGSQLFPKCVHRRLRGRERKKKWFKRRKCVFHHTSTSLSLSLSVCLSLSLSHARTHNLHII